MVLSLKMNLHNRVSYAVIKKLPDIYHEIITTFNKVKSIKQLGILHDADVLSHYYAYVEMNILD